MTAVDTTGCAVAEGEIVSVTTDRVVIGGDFPPGACVTDLRPGHRVALFNVEAIDDLEARELSCPACDDLADQRDVLRADLRAAKKTIADLKAKASTQTR